MFTAPVKAKQPRGFTLLEISLAVAILGMMALAIFRFVSANVIAVQVSSEVNEINAQFEGLERTLTDQFQELPPGQGTLLGEPFKFEGRSRDEMTWICSAGPGLFTRYASGQYSVTIRLRPMEKGKAMDLGVVRESEDETNPVPDNKIWVPLLSNITSLEIRYFDPRLNAWVDRWTDRGTLPHLVRLTIERVGARVPWVAIMPLRRTPY
ncbi:MAG TPA: prepilin-type N-terminal cleavage/methylation domain-containing protein [Chthoniobacterales bacterium]|jgi:prepilin-type N-terminal cleavage/methylation domain-containing protein